MKSWYWIQRELSALDVRSDYRRYAQLSFETRYGQPIFLHALFSVAFAYNMGDPEIAAVLHRGGRGKIMHSTRRRNFETLVFLGQIYQEGQELQLLAILAEVKKRHSPYQISNDLFLYTLSTFACLPKRLADRFGQQIDPKALESQFQLWYHVGQKMGIEAIPSTLDDFLAWMHDYERRHFRYTPAAEQVTRALAVEWAEYWFPKFAQPIAIKLFFALIDQPTRRVLGVDDDVPWYLDQLTTRAVTAYLAALNLLPSPRTEKHLVERFAAHRLVGVR